MKIAAVVLALAGFALAQSDSDNRPYELLIHKDGPVCSFVSLQKSQIHKDLLSNPNGRISWKTRVPTGENSASDVHHVLSYDKDLLDAHAESLCPLGIGRDLRTSLDIHRYAGSQQVFKQFEHADHDPPSLKYPPLDIEALGDTGPSSNRVDLVFFADGYTTGERDKFFSDAKRLAEDLSSNQTFYTVKPLLNFWGAFTPSKESGIGVGGKPKDTAFGLYRDGPELRGVLANKSDAALAGCASLGDGCDYAIVLGNDPLYGGIGGEYTSITASEANGPLVLRHELGHSIIDVGEEYDGGYAYFGVNAAPSTPSIGWSHWLSDPDAANGPVRAERSVMPLQAYPWTMMKAYEPWKVKFNSSGTYARHLIKFSLSGIPEAKDLDILLDGKHLKWSPKPGIGIDRWHYDIYNDIPLSDGTHEVQFVLKNSDRTTAQLCSVEVLEFGDEKEFVNDPSYYGAFPTFDLDNKTTYRPTYNSCLMRMVTSPDFCSVCLEGLWLSLLARVDLIDSVSASCVPPSWGPDWTRSISLDLLPLAQFREDGQSGKDRGEAYAVTWRKGGVVLEVHANKTALAVPDSAAPGVYTAEVEFMTDEVRKDEKGRLKASKVFVLDHTDSCAAKAARGEL
ncbi:hypothetical protein CONPUDRAFT_124060 [Coniophora puteana RWD-64-598 SS2]|uniref:IgA peptidase M64-domain-containing protein n=1 Tax=Coniophora puteana (strain RWD-64-598) TaxID=741705 RepID=A0A5M3MPJ7_CONPW|nr:uncharacterized protein CONPUDRAFT_124060 [Coniophora puteana RWD-64-598 SS2]EIW81109.1 hypothetical protein CONPUDRAFT_124060 [Coniophora puteana RWD-64-598 SS2]